MGRKEKDSHENYYPVMPEWYGTITLAQLANRSRIEYGHFVLEILEKFRCRE